MKNIIYIYLQKYSIFLFFKDYIIYLLSKKINIKFNGDIIIITSIIPFYKMKQRPQQIALSLSELYKNKTIIYYEIDFWTIKSSFEYFKDNLIITNSLFLIKRELKNRYIQVLATWNIKIPELFKLFNIKYSYIIFDYYDNLDWYDEYLFKTFLDNLSKYNKILCSAKLLENQLLDKWYKNIIYLPNWVNSNNWIIENSDRLIEVRNKYFNDNKKIVWFYWWIEHWLDYDLIKYIVKNNQNINFVFIWPDNWNFLKNNWLLDYSNFKYLGYMNFQELKYYSYFFDVAIIPFKINKITNAVSPVKFFEYLIQWKPVITTWFKEILFHNDYCFIWESFEDFNIKLQLAIKESYNNDYKTKIIDYSKKFEWDNLVKNIF